MSTNILIKAEALTMQGFALFGEVVTHTGTEQRHHIEQAFKTTVPAASPKMWINRILKPAATTPIIIDEMERHPHSFQTLIPLHSARFLVAVAPSLPDGSPDLESLRAFLTEPGQGVTYRPNVWHFGFTPLEGPNEVVVMIGITGREDDCIVSRLDASVEVQWGSDVTR